MKKYLFLIFLLIASISSEAHKVPSSGDWKGEEKDRAPELIPEFNIEDTQFSIWTEKELSDLEFYITDDSGNSVYYSIISCDANVPYLIPALLTKGKFYHYMLSHPLSGYLYGEFKVE